jgi:hypothetical protein
MTRELTTIAGIAFTSSLVVRVLDPAIPQISGRFLGHARDRGLAVVRLCAAVRRRAAVSGGRRRHVRQDAPDAALHAGSGAGDNGERNRTQFSPSCS